MRRALALYEGRFMPPLLTAPTREFEKWGDLWSSKVSRWTRLARLEAIDECKKSGRYRSALEIAQRWVREDEYQDEAQHALIELLFLNGHPSDAIRQFDTHRNAIRRELDVEPLLETVALAARIREESAPLKPVEAESKAIDVRDNSHSLSFRQRSLLSATALTLVLIAVALRARVALARAKLEGRGESIAAYEAAIRTALRWADSAVALAPEVAETTALRGILLHRLGWTLLRVDPDSSDVLVAEADSILRAAIELDPTNAETWLAFSEARRREGDVATARFAARRALEEDAYLRNAERVYQLLFVAELEVGNADEALEWIERGAELFPRDPRFLTGRLTLPSWTGEHVLSPDPVFAILRYLDSIDPPTNVVLECEYQRVHRLAMAAGALARADAEDAAANIIDSLAAEVRDVSAWRGPVGWDEAQARPRKTPTR